MDTKSIMEQLDEKKIEIAKYLKNPKYRLALNKLTNEKAGYYNLSLAKAVGFTQVNMFYRLKKMEEYGLIYYERKKKSNKAYILLTDFGYDIVSNLATIGEPFDD